MLTDRYGRTFSYIRLSITDTCNFSCQYCLPNGYTCESKKPPPLTPSEISRLLETLIRMGVRKVRLTGGEPTLRPDLCEIMNRISAFPEIDVLAMTSNGFRLKERLPRFVAAGLNHLNVSLDSLDPKKFHQLSGKNSLSQVMSGIDKAIELQLKALKVNTVLMKHFNYESMDQFLDWLKNRPLSLRFIELMKTGDNLAFFKDQHIRAHQLKSEFEAAGWTPVPRGKLAGPAQELSHPDYAGTVGFIAPYDKSFCSGCNRLRITSQGELRLCLFGNKNHSLRSYLQSQSQSQELEDKIYSLLKIKQENHELLKGDHGSTRHFAEIGG